MLRTASFFFLQCILWFTFSSASTPGVAEYYGFNDASNKTANSTLDLLLNWGYVSALSFLSLFFSGRLCV